MAPPGTRRQSLTVWQKFSYGVGHVFNDLTASMWFSYLLVYFHQVKNFNNKLAGNLMLIGQVSDALSTPFVGFESDRTRSGLCRMGRRKSWHFVGSLCVLLSFPFLFNKCINCEFTPDIAQFVYFVPFVVIFQFGWASVQISHLALIPELTSDESERVELNGIRFACTVLSNLAVYGIAWALLALGSSSSPSQKDLSAADSDKFRNLMFIVIGMGAVFSFIFHMGTREKPINEDPDLSQGQDALNTSTENAESQERSLLLRQKMTWKDWLKEVQFYQVAGIYMCTRLFVNLSQVYLPMYLVETLALDKTTIAIAPLIVYASSFVASLAMKPVNGLIGRKLTFLAGCLFAVGAVIWLWFIEKGATSKQVFGAAGLVGIGGSTMLVTALAMTSDLINENTESGAFVYGAMSFCDKLSNGVAIEVIQLFHPCVNCCPLCEPYYRHVQTLVPGGFAAAAILILGTVFPQNIGQRQRRSHKHLQSPATYGSSGTSSISNGVPAVVDTIQEDGSDSEDDMSAALMQTSINTPDKDLRARMHSSASVNTPVQDVVT